MTLPTKDEVDKRYEARRPRDILGFEVDEYLPYMSIRGLRAIADADVTDDTLVGFQKELNRESIIGGMGVYMAFAIEKAENMRGISANRSIEHYIAWTWLAGDKDFSSKIMDLYAHEYSAYGIHILREICEFYGFDMVIGEVP